MERLLANPKTTAVLPAKSIIVALLPPDVVLNLPDVVLNLSGVVLKRSGVVFETSRSVPNPPGLCTVSQFLAGNLWD
jgi:hypothetical protein